MVKISQLRKCDVSKFIEYKWGILTKINRLVIIGYLCKRRKIAVATRSAQKYIKMQTKQNKNSRWKKTKVLLIGESSAVLYLPEDMIRRMGG